MPEILQKCLTAEPGWNIPGKQDRGIFLPVNTGVKRDWLISKKLWTNAAGLAGENKMLILFPRSIQLGTIWGADGSSLRFFLCPCSFFFSIANQKPVSVSVVGSFLNWELLVWKTEAFLLKAELYYVKECRWYQAWRLHLSLHHWWALKVISDWA